MSKIQLNFLDHVAIRVKDLEASAAWYENLFGLTRYQVPEWGDFPILLFTGKTGIALFPARTEDPVLDPDSRNIKIDHFAFNVSKESFEAAKKAYESEGIEYHFMDHHTFHSLYIRDPDGHILELTTLVVPEVDFYGSGVASHGK